MKAVRRSSARVRITRLTRLARLTGIAALAAASLASRPASADDPPPGAGRRALAAGAAIVPGVLVHGSGSYVAGKKTTAKTLAITGGVGLVGALASVGLVALTGASRRVVGPLAAASVMGVGIFSTSMLADLYAVLAPEGGTGEPLREVPAIEAMTGAYAMSDPVFRQSALVVERLDLRWASLRTSVQGEYAPETVSRRLRVEEGVRLYGTRPGEKGRDGSFVDLEGALTDHAYPRDGFATTIGEVALRARMDLVRLDTELHGAFVEGQLGTGLVVDRYRGVDTSDTDSILLARFAFGTYLGVPSATGTHGEASVFYDHRRDGFVGGLEPNGIGAGYLGSVGAQGRMWLGRSFGIGANVAAGSALLGGLSLHFRSGILR